MLGKGGLVSQQRIDQPRPLVRRRVGREGPHFLGIRQQPDEVEVDPAEKRRVIQRGGPGLVFLREVVVDDPVKRVVALIHGGWQDGDSRAQRRFVGGLGEREPRLPSGTGEHPRFDRFDFLGVEALAFRWHPEVLVGGRHQFEKQAFLRLGEIDDRAGFRTLPERCLGIHGETAFLLHVGVTFGAVFLQDRDDFVGKVRRGRQWRRHGQAKQESWQQASG